MSKVAISVPVHASANFTLSYLHSHLREGAAGGPRLHLHVPLRPFGNEFSLEKDVAVSVAYAQDELTVRWVPEGDGAFPNFEGTLTASENGSEHCILTLTGTYRPPGGWPGKIFDAFAGGNIARSTIETLLNDLGAATEADFHIRSSD